VFKKLWKDIAANLDRYKGYPRIVGETGGKNFHIVHKSAEVRNAVIQSVRAAFEYQGIDFPSLSLLYGRLMKTGRVGQKCSALSRLYVSQSVWEGGFKDQFLEEVAKIKVGPPQDWSNFMGPVMFVILSVSLNSQSRTNQSQINSGRPAYDKIMGYIQKAKEAGGEILIGGTGLSSYLSSLFLLYIYYKYEQATTRKDTLSNPPSS
jgi:1-pyrroline-5-carboxylate dehydrogenase